MTIASPLAISQSNIKVYNAALSELGVPPVASFLEQSHPARVGNEVYANALEAEIAAYPWRFARTQVELAALPGPAPEPWGAAFALPDSALNVHVVYQGGVKVPFDVFGRTVLTRDIYSEPAKADISQMVAPDVWAAYFRRAFILKLAAAVAMSITMDDRLALLLEQKAERAMAYAKSRDAQGRSPSRVDTKAFIRARRGRAR
jgi:hypothetical protein